MEDVGGDDNSTTDNDDTGIIGDGNVVGDGGIIGALIAILIAILSGPALAPG